MKRLILIPLLSLFIFSCSKDSPHKKEVKQIDSVFYNTAFKFKDTLKAYDSAYYYFNKAKDVFLQQKDSLGAGKCLIQMAIISTDKGDFFGGQELSLNALSYLNENNEKHHAALKSNFNNLGIATSRANDDKNALKFYSLAIKYSDNPSDTWTYKNNIGNIYKDNKEYKKALEIFEPLLKDSSANEIQYARTLTNFSVTKWLLNVNYNPVPNLLKALHIREKENDISGLNSSYTHLSSYYRKNKPDSALFYAKIAYLTSKKNQNPDDQLLALKELIKSSPAKQSLQYFDKFESLDDSLILARNKDKNQFAVIRYDAEKHKAESLKLQKDNTEKTYQIIFLAAGSAVLLIAGTFWYRKRKQRLEMEKENAIKESRLKTSKKVHDVVANGLYRVMNKIEYQPELDKEVLLDEIEDLYEKSRDISYEKPLAPTAHFHQKIASLIYSFNTDQIEVHLMGNTAALWNKVELTAKDEVIHILQELLVNMRKHSQASEVTLQFTKTEHELHIIYEDNGIGIKGEVKSNNGLRNTETRIKNLNGQITFETGSEKGLRINFSFPVSSKT
ncbi:tetratricopeptide repeat-containing sensor histidine kinase [Pedobacter sp. ASV12]|uniref:tetratricopeptide repeat-containing sensor histidine kinase n=1 Tax=Pedobacter sp. ASV12 TaxID=2795120 RepID=UPI001E442015|nr:ATP-binding protein [Pedobacter sp. ASV12]